MSINQEPFLTLARDIIDNQRSTTYDQMALGIAELLCEHGNESDIKRIGIVAQSAKPGLSIFIERQQERLSNKLAQKTMKPEAPHDGKTFDSKGVTKP